MSSAQRQPIPSPEPIFETLTAFERSFALKGAIDLDLFTAIGEGNNTVASIARRIRASERGTRILCDYLSIIGFLAKSDGQYRLPPMTAMFLDRRSPAYMGTAAGFLSQIHNRHFFDDVAELVRKGHSLATNDGTVGADDSIWVEFAHSMAPLMALPAQFIAELLSDANVGSRKVLDVAAGHGLFGIALAQANPEAHVWGLDWARVLEVARKNAASSGVAERYHTMPGSAFDIALGTGYDIVLLTNFLHHFDPPTCEGLLRKVRAALNPDGCVATLEFVPNEDRISPAIAAEFSMTMLATTPNGDAYTYTELDRMFRNAGFPRNEIHVVPPGAESLIVSRA